MINMENFSKFAAITKAPEVIQAILQDKKRYEEVLILRRSTKNPAMLIGVDGDIERLSKRIVNGLIYQHVFAKKSGLPFLEERIDKADEEQRERLIKEFSGKIYE